MGSNLLIRIQNLLYPKALVLGPCCPLLISIIFHIQHAPGVCRCLKTLIFYKKYMWYNYAWSWVVFYGEIRSSIFYNIDIWGIPSAIRFEKILSILTILETQQYICSQVISGFVRKLLEAVPLSLEEIWNDFFPTRWVLFLINILYQENRQ